MERFTQAGQTLGPAKLMEMNSATIAGRLPFWPRPHLASTPRALLAECHRQQTRAQQHEAGRRQGKKSVGDNVVVAHETPTTPDARPNLLKISKFHVEIVRPYIRSPAVPPNRQTFKAQAL